VTVFEPGRVIERREVLHGLPWLVLPVQVVRDDGEELAVYVAEGTPFAFPDHPFGRHPWSQRTRWTDTSVLQVHRAGDAHAVWGMYEQGVFAGWYVNFQAPLRRWSAGFDTLDHGVDMWIPNGASEWQWKDLEDVARLVQVGRITEDEARDVWSETERVAGSLRGGVRWWQHWDGWSPGHH
jgi:hypothetical protein